MNNTAFLIVEYLHSQNLNFTKEFKFDWDSPALLIDWSESPDPYSAITHSVIISDKSILYNSFVVQSLEHFLTLLTERRKNLCTS